MRTKVRSLRHWKQRFNKDAEFIWRRRVTYGGESCKPGEPIPDTLTANKAKLRRFWESGTIELAQFEEPNVLTGQVRQPTPSETMVRELERQRKRSTAVTLAEAEAEAVRDFEGIEDDANDDWLGTGFGSPIPSSGRA